jgi:hypothetical protein
VEDSKWEDSATQWEAAYRKVKADRDALEVKLQKICEAAMKLQRGCDCEYDYRCGNCEQIVQVHNVLEEMIR